MRDFQRPEPCPECASRSVAVLHSTPAALYLACRACDHTWHVEAVDPLLRHTSAAFRMSTRIVSGTGPLVSVG